MKLKALFLFGVLGVALMSFCGPTSGTGMGGGSEATCNGSTNPCCASPGRFLG